MFLTAHTLIALSTTKFIDDPASLFFINFFLHYVFDIIPHGKWTSITNGFKNQKINMAILAVTDFIFVFFITHTLYGNRDNFKNIVAIFGACLPDFLWGIYAITKCKFLKWASMLDSWSHNVFKFERESAWFFCFQIIPIIIFLITFYK